MKKLFLLFLSVTLFTNVFAQQEADTSYHPYIASPAYERGKGSIVFIDEGHHNFHTKDGRYKAFANLLESDGYVVKGYQGAFDREKLSQGKILVISNALHESNIETWERPVLSAFTPEDIEEVKQWVSDGGSLFLIADHMPLAGASIELAKAFGLKFTDGFVFKTKTTKGAIIFNKKEKSLANNIITSGRSPEEAVEKVASFTGQAFLIPEEAEPILIIPENYVNLIPRVAWKFDKDTKQIDAGGWSQGAYMPFGKGKIVAFGEAAMFTAQVYGPKRTKAGMNTKVAKENYKLLLNIMHWLDGKLD